MNVVTNARRWDADTSWKADAACSTAEPGLFFPAFPEDEPAPKAICARCPSKDACLQWALDTNEPHGIWGGLNEKERFNLRKRMMKRGWQPPRVVLPPPTRKDRREAYERRATELWGARP